ncbi:MAG: FAD-dependent monooxygenase [Pseudomonadota bacterium]
MPINQLSQCYRKANRMIGVLPVGSIPGRAGQHATIFWSLPRDGHALWRERDLSCWKSEASELWPDMAPFLTGIAQHEDMTLAHYAHGTLKTPVAPGLAHIGDAAHRASPQLGQGANMALLDAYALVWALTRAEDVNRALTLYARSRRWHVWLYQLLSAAFTPQYQSDSAVLPVVRDRLLMPLSKLPPLPHMLSQLVCGSLVPPVAGEAYIGGVPVGLGRQAPERF